MGLPARLVSWELDSRQHLLCGRECRSFLLVCEAGAQDVCAITLLKSLRPIHSSLYFHGERSGHLRCPASSVWRRSSPIANSSGKEQAIEQVWEEYFADPSQWWDNRVAKVHTDCTQSGDGGFGRWHINFGGAQCPPYVPESRIPDSRVSSYLQLDMDILSVPKSKILSVSVSVICQVPAKATYSCQEYLHVHNTATNPPPAQEPCVGVRSIIMTLKMAWKAKLNSTEVQEFQTWQAPSKETLIGNDFASTNNCASGQKQIKGNSWISQWAILLMYVLKLSAC